MSSTAIIPSIISLLELAIHHCNNQDDQHRNDRDRYHPICSHPTNPLVSPHFQDKGKGSNSPTSHPPQRLNTPIHIPLTLQHRLPRMLNRLPLQLQIRQRAPPNILRLIRYPLTIPQPLRAPVQSICAGKQLLALLQLVVLPVFVVTVAVPEEGFAVVGEGFELAFRGVDVDFVVSEAGVQARASGGGDVLFFEAHLVELEEYGYQQSA